MRRFIKKRSNSRSTVDKVVNNEEEFIGKLAKPSSIKNEDDSGYSEKERLKIKSFSCEDLLAVGSCSQNRRRQSTAASHNMRINTKSTSSSGSSTSEEQISQCLLRPNFCSVNIDGKGQCKLLKEEYDEATFENEPVKHRTKASVHLKLSRNQSDTFRYQNVVMRRLSGDLTSLPVLDDFECQKVEEAYEEALKYGAVDVTYVRLMLIGLPEAGKTTTRYSLMGEKAPHDLSRTKLVEPCQKPIRRQLAITGKCGWSYINHDQEDEDLAILLNRLMSCNENESRICSQKNSSYQDPWASQPVHSLKSFTSDTSTDMQGSPVQVNLPRNVVLSRSNSLSPVNILPLPPKPAGNKSNTISSQQGKAYHEYSRGSHQTASQSTDEIYEDIESLSFNDTKSSAFSPQAIPIAGSSRRDESPQDVSFSSLTTTTVSKLDTPTVDLRSRTQSMPLAKSRDLSISSTDLTQHRRSSNAKTPDAGMLQTKFLEQGSKFRQKIKQSVISMLKEQDGLDLCTDCDNEVLINIWDCGGQFVFREILPAFLAQKVAYLLIYDASKDLEEVYKEPGTYPGCYAEGNTFQHLQKWMAAIHAHSTLLLPCASLYPRMLVIGTHGDALKTEEGSYEEAKQKIVSEIKSYFKGKRFADLVLAHFIVDNTTGGEGYDQEDPSFEMIRCQVEDYAKQSLTISTPISWVLFRRVFQATITEAGIPVVSMSLAKEIATECKIDEDTLSQVLVFYHQVGLLLHYASVPILNDVVIADPQWLVNSLSMLFTLPSSTEQEELASLWTQLHEKGVLEKALYESIWCNCGIDPQGLLNLLEYFLLAAPIKHEVKKLFSDSAYFVPSLLNSWASEEDSSSFEDAVEIASPLFLVFNTEYVPPGFFIRLAASFSGVDGVEIMFDSGIYRNRITFAIGEADELTMVENLESIKITLARYFNYHNGNSLQFSQACQNAKQNLLACCFAITQQWMPGVKVITAFQCEKPQCSDKPPHYIHFDNTIKLCLRCSYSKIRTQPSQSQKLWLQPPNPVQDTKDEGITMKVLSKVAVKLNATRLEPLACHLGIDSFQYDAIKEDNTKHYERAMAVLKEWYNMGKGGIGELYQSLQETGHYQAARQLPMKHESGSRLSMSGVQFSGHLPMSVSPYSTHFQHRQMSFRKKYHTPATNNSTKELTLSTIVQISSKIHDENKLLVLAVLLGFTEQEFFDMQCDYHTIYILALHMITKWWKKYNASYMEFSEYLKAAGLSHTLP